MPTTIGSASSVLKDQKMHEVKEPTTDQCSEEQKVYESEHKVGFALWFPQLGGYHGKAVALFDKNWKEMPSGSRSGGCVDIYVWHDGEFPFGGGKPRELHLCDPEQFIQLGQTLKKLNDSNSKKKEMDDHLEKLKEKRRKEE